MFAAEVGVVGRLTCCMVEEADLAVAVAIVSAVLVAAGSTELAELGYVAWTPVAPEQSERHACKTVAVSPESVRLVRPARLRAADEVGLDETGWASRCIVGGGGKS